jgi:hypothetical protein
LDKEVTLSPKSLIRLIGSTNSKTGTENRVVDLDHFDVERASALPRSPATLHGDDVKKGMKYQDSQTGLRMSELADAPTQFLFLGTQVAGTVNRNVVLIRFPFGTPLELIRPKLQHLLQTSQLAPFILFESLSQDRAYFALSPSAVEKEHLPRLLKDFPEAKASYVRYSTRHLPLPVRYVCTIGSWRDERLLLSRAHANVLKKILEIEARGIMCGNSHLRVGIGEVA